MIERFLKITLFLAVFNVKASEITTKIYLDSSRKNSISEQRYALSQRFPTAEAFIIEDNILSPVNNGVRVRSVYRAKLLASLHDNTRQNKKELPLLFGNYEATKSLVIPDVSGKKSLKNGLPKLNNPRGMQRSSLGYKDTNPIIFTKPKEDPFPLNLKECANIDLTKNVNVMAYTSAVVGLYSLLFVQMTGNMAYTRLDQNAARLCMEDFFNKLNLREIEDVCEEIISAEYVVNSKSLSDVNQVYLRNFVGDSIWKTISYISDKTNLIKVSFLKTDECIRNNPYVFDMISLGRDEIIQTSAVKDISEYRSLNRPQFRKLNDGIYPYLSEWLLKMASPSISKLSMERNCNNIDLKETPRRMLYTCCLSGILTALDILLKGSEEKYCPEVVRSFRDVVYPMIENFTLEKYSRFYSDVTQINIVINANSFEELKNNTSCIHSIIGDHIWDCISLVKNKQSLLKISTLPVVCPIPKDAEIEDMLFFGREEIRQLALSIEPRIKKSNNL